MATTQKTVAVEEMQENHKCLLYWHARNMHSIPVVAGNVTDRVILYPGYNSVDSIYLDSIFRECKDIIDSGRLEVKGCTYKDGKVIESFYLSKCSAAEFAKILSATYTPNTLLDLADASIVSPLLTGYATARKKKLDEAVGNEADNIEVRGEETHGL